MKQKYDCNRECSTCAYNDNSDYLRRTMQKEEIYDKLRQKGCRITKQRQTLIDIIIERECSCCKEIYYIASKKMPALVMEPPAMAMRVPSGRLTPWPSAP